jgi:hypothetical protein
VEVLKSLPVHDYIYCYWLHKPTMFHFCCSLVRFFKPLNLLDAGIQVQMNEEQDSSTGSSITLFTLRSIYSTTEDEQIQFQFKAGTLEMIVRLSSWTSET